MFRSLTRLISVTALLGLSALSVQAADLPRPTYKAPPIAIPVFSWTGFYVGGNVGYAWAKTDWTGGAGDFTVSPKGFLGGLTLGYNYQTGSFVWGVEADLDYANLKGTETSALCASCTIKDTWFGTFRGRIGYALDRWMPYVTGGGAWGNVYVSGPGGSATSTKGGWSAGAGVEYSWGGPWSAKVEYLYVDLGDAHCDASVCGTPSQVNAHFTSNLIRAGINYRF